MAGLASLPHAKWSAGGRQPVLNQDFIDIEDAILQSAGGGGSSVPYLSWVDASAVRVKASSDLQASVVMSGFPNVFHPGAMVSAGLTDCGIRINSANVDMDFDVTGNHWGAEKVDQWYHIYAISGDSDSTFTLKAMPFCRISSQTSQTILFRDNSNAADIGYGFTTDELVGAKIYIITGASKGAIRTISANNNNRGTVTYTGDVLTLAQGDWLAILPATNFRWLGDILNSTYSNIWRFERRGSTFYWVKGDESGGYPPGYTSSSALTPEIISSVNWVTPVGSASPLAGEMLGILNFMPPVSLDGTYVSLQPGTANWASYYSGMAVPVGWPLYMHEGDGSLFAYNVNYRVLMQDGKIAIYNGAVDIYALGWVYPDGYL